MSGPKGGSYSIAEERRRAESRRQALLSELAAAQASLRVAQQVAAARVGSGQALGVPELRLSVDERSTASIESAVTAVRSHERLVRQTAATLASATARARTLGHLTGGIGPARARTSAEAMAGVVPERGTGDVGVTAADRARLDAALASLDPDVADDQEELLTLAERLIDASGDMRRSILDDVERRVRRLNQQAEAARRHVDAAQELDLRLVGTGGEPARELRRRLHRVIEEGCELDPTLVAAVDELVAERRLVEDRLQVAEALRDSLAALGYVVGPEFTTELGGGSVAYAERAGWTEHLLEVRLPPGGRRVVLAAVRDGDPDADASSADRVRDAEVEREFCDTVNPLLGSLDDAGVHVGPLVRNQAGEHPMNVVVADRRSETRRARRAAPQEREAR